MPRNVRNFWITTMVDGKQTAVATGPRSKDGGFTTTIQMRDKGGILRALTIEGAAVNNALVLRVASDAPIDVVRQGAPDGFFARIMTTR